MRYKNEKGTENEYFSKTQQVHTPTEQKLNFFDKSLNINGQNPEIAFSNLEYTLEIPFSKH